MATLFCYYWAAVFLFEPKWTKLVPSLKGVSIKVVGCHFNKVIVRKAVDLHVSQGERPSSEMADYADARDASKRIRLN